MSNLLVIYILLIYTILGEMILNNATKVFPVPDKKGKPLYQFVVTCGASGKVFKISANDQREKSEWLCENQRGQYAKL